MDNTDLSLKKWYGRAPGRNSICYQKEKSPAQKKNQLNTDAGCRSLRDGVHL